MFDHTHYVPVLRWKRGEWVALRELFPADRCRITPLIELIPRNLREGDYKGREERPRRGSPLSRIAEDIRNNWGDAPFFMDLTLLAPVAPGVKTLAILESLTKLSLSAKLRMVPVSRLDKAKLDERLLANSASLLGNGLAIRVTRYDIETRRATSALESLPKCLGVPREDMDLIVDLGTMEDGAPTIQQVCLGIPDLGAWRTLTVACGAFPKNLSEFSVGQHELTRSDWRYWKSQVAAPRRPDRLPTYGDYTIQHATFHEAPALANVSASIRYAAEDHWVIMRGEGLRNSDGPGFAQYPANAQLLAKRPEFLGAEFSYGDSYIDAIGRQQARTGTPELWLRAGINHHITLTARQVARLFGT